MKNRLKNNLN